MREASAPQATKIPAYEVAAVGRADCSEQGDGGGAEGSRTPDLLIANETLYQLSYDPNQRIR